MGLQAIGRQSARVGRFLRRAAVRALRRLPAFRRMEGAACDRIERALARGTARSGVLGSLLLDVQLLREALVARGDYRVVDLDAPTADDEALLRRLGTSVERLSALRCDRRLKQSVEVPKPRSPEIFDTRYQADALRARRFAFTSPFSGRPLATTRSLLCGAGHPVFYRFVEDGRAFFVAVGRESFGYQPVYFYLPEEQVVVLLGDRDWAWLGRWEVDQLRAFMVRHAGAVQRYLDDPSPPAAVALVDHHHFAHHLWNCLTGVQALVAAGSPFDKLAATAEPMGPIDRLFPEVPRERLVFLSDAELPLRALRENWFLVRAGGLVVDDALVRRVCAAAAESAPEVAAQAAALRASHAPIVWVTVRTGSRSWVSQAEGIAALAAALAREHPRLALVVDGFAVPWVRRESDRFGWIAKTVAEERAVVDALRARLDAAIPLVVNVGTPIAASVLYSQVIDAYVATHGSLQNKIGWLANKPGVVHGNKLVLTGIAGPVRDYCAFWSRAGGVAPLYLDPGCVTDVEAMAGAASRRWANTLSKYEVGVPEVLKALRSVVQPAADPRAAPA